MIRLCAFPVLPCPHLANRETGITGGSGLRTRLHGNIYPLSRNLGVQALPLRRLARRLSSHSNTDASSAMMDPGSGFSFIHRCASLFACPFIIGSIALLSLQPSMISLSLLLPDTDRKSVVEGKSVELGGRRNIKKKKQ